MGGEYRENNDIIRKWFYLTGKTDSCWRVQRVAAANSEPSTPKVGALSKK